MIIRRAILVLILVGLSSLGMSTTHVSAVDDAPAEPAAHTRTVIISLRHTLPPEDNQMARNDVMMRRVQIRQLQEAFVATALPDTTVWSMQSMPVIVATLDDEALARLQQDPAVASVHESRLFGHMTSESSSHIGASALHATGITGAGMSVAVLDTGVDGQHIALRGQIIKEACFSTTNDTYGSTSLCTGGASTAEGVGSAAPCDLRITACNHGTHVAGIVAGRVVTLDGVTTRGMAPDAKIIAVQVFSRFAAGHAAGMCGASATGDCVFAYEHDLLRALDWLYVNYDASTWGTLAAVNMSLGDGSYAEACDAIGGSEEYPFKWYIDQLRSIGVATVVAAGNAGSTNGVAYPACVSSAISVGSVSSYKPVYGDRDRPSLFSNTPSFIANQPNGNGDRLLDFYAPGELIRSSIATNGGSSFAEYSGTSMAAPHVAGAWALIKSLRPRASVSQVRTWLTDTGQLITESRPGVDARLQVPRIHVAAAASMLRAANAPVSISMWSIDMGDVHIGQSLRQRVTVTYHGVPATVRMVLSGRHYQLDTRACAGFVDDMTPTCSVDVLYAPATALPGQINTASIRVEINRLVYTIGITGRAVSRMPEMALTQTARVVATNAALLTRTATPTLWPTPSAHVSAKTVIAIATRTQRRRAEIAVTVTQRAVSYAQTATQHVVSGGATYTPSATPTATRTRTPLAIVHTIVHAQTATRRALLQRTATAYVAATRTQSAKNQGTAVAMSIAQTATQLRASGQPTYTTIPRTRVPQTKSATRTLTPTVVVQATRTPSIAYITTHNETLHKRHRALVRSPLGDVSLLLYAGDFGKSFAPELTIVLPATLQRSTTLRLPGMDATALTAVVNAPNQFVVAGRLNWNSLYVQIYEVRGTTFVLRSTHITPLATGASVTALYATDQRIMLAVAAKVAPTAELQGQLLVFARQPSNQYEQLVVNVASLAGVATTIRAIDDADERVIVAGYVPGATKTGFIQSLHLRTRAYESLFVLPRPYPITDLVSYSVLRGLTRLHLLFAAQTQGIAVLHYDERNGVMAQYQLPLDVAATKLDEYADQLAVIGFDSSRRLNVTSVYQWSMDRLQLRRTITHANRDGGIVGIALHGTRLIFVDTDWMRFSR